jgi:ribonuclease E
MGRRRRGGSGSGRKPRNTERKLLINARESEESRLAVIEGGRLEEYYIERSSLGSTLGNVYKARVVNIEKSIGAAFLDFGHTRQGFLHVSDLCMAAVGEGARDLLASVQAAREHAHDDDMDGLAGDEDSAKSKGKESADGEDSPEPADDAGDTTSDDAPDAKQAGDAVAGSDDDPADTDTDTDTDADTDTDTDADTDTDTEAVERDDDLDAEAPGFSGEAESIEPGDDADADSDSDEHDADEVDPDDEEPSGDGDDAGPASVPPGSAAFAHGDGFESEPDDEDHEPDEGDAAADDDQGSEGDGSAEVYASAAADGETAESGAVMPGAAGGAVASATGSEEESDGGGTAVAPGPEETAETGGRSRRSRGGRRRGGRRGRGRDSADTDNGDAGSGGSSDAEASSEGGAEDGDRKRASRGGRSRGGRGGRSGRTGRAGRNGERGRTPREMPPIQDILHKGQEIVVQVIKDGIGTKGPTLTTYLSIPGRFLVLMPGINKRGVSRKVVDAGERNRLKQIVRELEVPDELGFIVRTAGVSASAEDLQRDLDYLLKVWDQMRVRVEEFSAPVLLYQENDLVIRTLRDLYDGKGDIIVDDAATAQTARDFLTQIMPACVDKVQLYDGEQPLFGHFKIEEEINLLLENRIELRSGGSLIIEQTEALVAIDVNSGRFKAEPGSNFEDTAFLVNSEAATEIARQIRLRDLGGVVVVDFIDMRAEKHRKALENHFKEALRRDRARLKVARFSPFGIIELTRQRVRPSLKRSVHAPCPYCVGTGYIPSDETSCLTVVRKVREQLSKPGGVLVVTVRPEVAEAVLNQQRDTLVALEQESHKQIFVRSDHRLSYEDVEVRAMVALPDDLDHRRA